MKKNKHRIFAIAMMLSLASCSTGNPYRYIYTMTKPQVSTEKIYEDDKIKFDFSMGMSDVSFKASNKTDKPMKIIWDEASFVNEGEAQKITHKNVKYIDSEKSQAPTVIPPHAFVSEIIQPIDDIKLVVNPYAGKYGQSVYWSKKPFFPVLNGSKNTKYVETVVKPIKGKKVNIYIPVQYEGKTLEYYFEIEITDIRYETNRENRSIFE